MDIIAFGNDNEDSNRVTILCLEGNIGSGKSTLVNKLIEDNVYAVREPVEKFQAIPGTDTKPLKMYYETPHKVAPLFQCYAQSTLTINTVRETKYLNEQCKKNNTKSVVVFERMVENNMETFGKLTRQYMSENEFDMLNCVSNTLIAMSPKPDGMIYLDVEPEECFRRIKNRNRSCEQSIPINYLYQFKELADVYIDKKKKQGFPVLHLTNNLSISEMVSQIKTFGFRVMERK